MPAPAAATEPLLTEQARALLTRRLAAAKGRDDVEVLAVAGVGPGSVLYQGQSRPGLVFMVTFAYAGTRRVRRTAKVTWPIGVYVGPGTGTDPNVPEALWDLLDRAVAAAGAAG